ncbi:M61 family metallopeptidase [Niveibacterium umoris]|uniref:M61 family metallopeptidase n=1 Tax=Niveibacterium umoris TaxID=1193620 RepID=UPI001617863C|nr:PDZ domain-containing protein [Niveibacterium umoris]
MQPVRYTITPADPAAHLFEVTLEIDTPASGQRFLLPAWIPGSYMVREFARNIVWLKGECDGVAVKVDKADKHTWVLGRVAAGAKVLRLTYAVYAWDLSVRCAHLDATHGFFNGTQVFLRVEGREQAPHRVRIDAPVGVRGWSVATSLPEAAGRGGAKRKGFGWYEAPDYDALIDHPVEMGALSWVSFEVRGVSHDFAINGRHDCDLARLAADVARACEAQCALFGDAPPPFERYVFMLTVVGDGYGGLEHRDSTALLASRNDLPFPGMKDATEAYRGFLGLCSHEYFHAWNVKRIKPAAFAPYDLQQENYTRLLWLFEGFTSYYDDLALVRAGLVSHDEYLALVAKTAGAVARGAGRAVQSVAESSFDAWIKYYRQDENAPNAIVSYYAKGSLVALALDLTLRAKSAGRKSLDDVMRLLWARHGAGDGVAEDAMPGIIREATGIDVTRLLRSATEGVEDLPLEKLLKPFGVRALWQAEGEVPYVGAKLATEGESVKFAQVFSGGPAHAACISAGDLLIAVDGLRVKAGGLEARLTRHKAGDQLRLHLFRRDELYETSLTLAAPLTTTLKLSIEAKAAKGAAKLRQGWLGGN